MEHTEKCAHAAFYKQISAETWLLWKFEAKPSLSTHLWTFLFGELRRILEQSAEVSIQAEQKMYCL